MQRQIDRFSMIQVSYEGSWTDHLSVGQNINSVPAAYFTTGQIVNPNNGKLTANVTNPFALTNFSSLQAP